MSLRFVHVYEKSYDELCIELDRLESLSFHAWLGGIDCCDICERITELKEQIKTYILDHNI